jgi:hypothetical protein
MRRLLVLGVVGLAALAHGGPKTLVVAAGDCRNVELNNGMRDFSGALREQLHQDLFDAELVLDIIRPRASRSLEDVKRQVESARTLLYSGQRDRAVELVKQALSELDRASPQVHPWEVTAEALVVQAQLARDLGRKSETLDAWRRVLRIDPGYKLDPDYFTPSELTAFDQLRKELLRTRKVALQVQSAPAGAEVFLDGRSVGKTPLRLDVLPGSYRLSLVLGEQVSFTRTVSAPSETVVDLAAEGVVSTEAPVCLATDDNSAAFKLATLVGADAVAVLRLTSTRGNPSFYRATLAQVRTGTLVREGGVQTAKLRALAHFIATGVPTPDVETGKAPVPAPSVTTPPSEPSPTVAPAVVLTPQPVDPPPATPVSAPTSHLSGARVTAWVLLGAGAVSAVVGGVVYAAGGADRQTLADLTLTGKLPAPSNPGHRDALNLMPGIDANRQLSMTLLGAGAGLVAAGLVTLALFPAETPVQTAVLPLPGGASVAIAGSF